ncbi:MAG TPA: DUF1585 domain-containing protein [Kofleriaceae bacterium]
MKRATWALVVIAACDPAPTPTPPPEPQVEYLSPTEHLVRASMTLRGIRPSVADLERVAADPEAIVGIVDGYIESPAFGRVMRDLHAETFLVRVDLPTFKLRPEAPLDQIPVGQVNRSVWEEPLALIEHVITTDRPYTEIVTAPYTFSDPISKIVWGTDYGGGGEERVSHYLDGRPASGILSSSALYARHTSAGSNYHRARANMLSNTLLCFDYLHGDVILDTSIDLSNPEVVTNAVRVNPACVGCHQSLDPFASFLWGLQPGARFASFPIPMWRPGSTMNGGFGTWQETTGRPPSLNGKPGDGIVDLGRLIAADPRFARCTAARFAGYFTQTDHAAVPFAWVARLTDAFLAANQSAKVLAREIVLSEEFRRSHVTDAAPDELADELHGFLRVRPEQLDTMLQDLAGFTWSTTTGDLMTGTPYGGANLLRSDFLGFRAIAGGIDSYYVTEPTHTTNTMASLVQRVVAAAAAHVVVDADLAVGATPRLLTQVTAMTRDEPTLRAQIAALHARIYGQLEAVDAEAVGETYQLFASVLASTGDVRHAWKTTLTAMLGDLRVAYY